MVVGDEVEQDVAFSCHRGQLAGFVHAESVTFGAIPVPFRLAVIVRHLLRVLRFLGLRFVFGDVLAVQCLGDLRDERLVPVAHASHGLVEIGAVPADHRAGDRIGQGEHPAGDGAEFRVALDAHDVVHMPVEHGVDELHGPGLAQRLRVLVESDKQTVLAHDALEERIICGDFRFMEHARRRFSGVFATVGGDGRRDSRQQFGRGLAREGEAEDLLRGNALPDQGDDASGHRVGFAGSGTGHDHHVLIGGGLDDGRLFGTVGEFRLVAHAVLLSNTVFSSPAQAGHTSLHRQ